MILAAVLCLVAEWSMAQNSSLGVAYYDVDALYDTIPSRFYDDRAYTPEGSLRWSGERYRRKVRHVAAVIDSLGMPIVALRGVESEQVVRDVVSESKNLYSYVHRTVDFNRGEDFALLYFGDRFTPQSVWQYRGALCIEGEVVGGGALAIVVHRRSYDLRHIIGRIKSSDRECRVVVMGESSGEHLRELSVKDHCADMERRGLGTRRWRGRWQMRDRIASDIGGRVQAGVYIGRWLLCAQGDPLPTFSRGKYVGGYSSNLPVYVYFDEFFVN